MIKMKEIEAKMTEISIGHRVAFGRQCSRKEPAVGIVEKVNRMSYRIRLTEDWVQVKRTYPKGGKFRVSKGMVWRFFE